MILRSTLLFLWHLIREITGSSENTTYDSYEFKFNDNQPINYHELIAKVNKINKTTTDPQYGTAWEDFTDDTMFLINFPHEQDSNETSTTDPPDIWNIPANAIFLTFGPNETETTLHAEHYTTTDLTHFTTHNFTFEDEKRFFEVRDLTRYDDGEFITVNELNDFQDTDDPVLVRGNEEFLYPYTNMTSSEMERDLKIENFYNFTYTSTPSPPSTWNPFIIQSEERWELDRIAKAKRMATNNMYRDQLRSGNMGGLGGLLGGMIPINIGNLFGGANANMKTITLLMGGTKPKTSKTTTTMIPIITKTFKPRPSPDTFMDWKFLEDGSPRPDMDQEEFIRILKKSGTPPPYYEPPISIPAHVSEDLLENLRSQNVTVHMKIEEDQKERIYNFLNPFIQQHTAMDLINQDKTMGVITTQPSSTTPSTFHRTYFTLATDPECTLLNWKASPKSETVDLFANENMMKVLNEGVKEQPWKEITLKTQATVEHTHSDPRVRIVEENFDNFYDRKAQEARLEQGRKAKEAFDKHKEEIKQSGKTKPVYWKEVIGRVPEELYETKSGKHTSTQQPGETNRMFNWAFEEKTKSTEFPHYSTTLWFQNTYKLEITRSKWTTPVEDRERLNTILSFMFPYIQKKSDIFDIHHKTPGDLKVDQSTKFDPWGVETNSEPPEIKKLFDIYSSHFPRLNTTRRT